MNNCRMYTHTNSSRCFDMTTLVKRSKISRVFFPNWYVNLQMILFNKHFRFSHIMFYLPIVFLTKLLITNKTETVPWLELWNFCDHATLQNSYHTKQNESKPISRTIVTKCTTMLYEKPCAGKCKICEWKWPRSVITGGN